LIKSKIKLGLSIFEEDEGASERHVCQQFNQDEDHPQDLHMENSEMA